MNVFNVADGQLRPDRLDLKILLQRYDKENNGGLDVFHRHSYHVEIYGKNLLEKFSTYKWVYKMCGVVGVISVDIIFS